MEVQDPRAGETSLAELTSIQFGILSNDDTVSVSMCFNFLLLLLAPMFWSFSSLSKILIINERNSSRQGLRQHVVLFLTIKIKIKTLFL